MAFTWSFLAILFCSRKWIYKFLFAPSKPLATEERKDQNYFDLGPVNPKGSVLFIKSQQTLLCTLTEYLVLVGNGKMEEELEM